MVTSVKFLGIICLVRGQSIPEADKKKQLLTLSAPSALQQLQHLLGLLDSGGNLFLTCTFHLSPFMLLLVNQLTLNGGPYNKKTLESDQIVIQQCPLETPTMWRFQQHPLMPLEPLDHPGLPKVAPALPVQGTLFLTIKS